MYKKFVEMTDLEFSFLVLSNYPKFFLIKKINIEGSLFSIFSEQTCPLNFKFQSTSRALTIVYLELVQTMCS